jgi:N-acetylglutamate synthase-like GNAT family acetyltransferase
MTAPINLREARASDAEFLLALARDAYRDVLTLQFNGWEESVHGRRFAEKVATLPFFIAELDGAAVAALSWSLHPDHLRVNELVVLPAVQNRGVGSQLLLRVLDQARNAGLPVRLHTFRLNRAAQFYQRHGFVVTEQRNEAIDLEWCG